MNFVSNKWKNVLIPIALKINLTFLLMDAIQWKWKSFILILMKSFILWGKTDDNMEKNFFTEMVSVKRLFKTKHNTTCITYTVFFKTEPLPQSAILGFLSECSWFSRLLFEQNTGVTVIFGFLCNCIQGAKEWSIVALSLWSTDHSLLSSSLFLNQLLYSFSVVQKLGLRSRLAFVVEAFSSRGRPVNIY